MDNTSAGSKRRSMLIPPGHLTSTLARSSQIQADDVAQQTNLTRDATSGIRRTQSIRANATHARQPSVPSAASASAMPRRANPVKPPRPVSMIASLPSSRTRPTGLPTAGSRLQPVSAFDTNVDLSMVDEASEPFASGVRAAGLPKPSGPELRRVPNLLGRHTRTLSTQSIQTDASDPTVSPPSASPRKLQAPSQGPLSRTASIRPAFSTHQQHFSPKKSTAPKPASMSIVNAPSKPLGMGEVPPEIQIVQTELLQLELLHQAFHESLTNWNASAAKKLRQRFDDATFRTERVGLSEQQVQLQCNVAALRDWGVTLDESDLGSTAADEYLQILCNGVTETTRLTVPGGSVEQILSSARQWMMEVEQVWAARRSSGASLMDSGYGPSATPTVFLENSNTSWIGDIQSIQRRLVSLQKDLDLLPPALAGSSLARIKDGFHNSIRLIRENLQVVAEAHAMMDTAEQNWIDEYAAALIAV